MDVLSDEKAAVLPSVFLHTNQLIEEHFHFLFPCFYSTLISNLVEVMEVFVWV